MATTMDLITFAQSEHILAAFTRQDSSGPQPDAADLVGDGLLLRDPVSGDTLVTLPADQLAVKTVDLREDVLLTARRFSLRDNLPEQDPQPGPNPVQLDGMLVTVVSPNPAPRDLEAWVYIEGSAGLEPILHKVEIAETTLQGSENLMLPPGDYRVLALLPGYQPALVRLNVA